MRAGVFEEVGKPLIIQDIERPKPGPGEALIRVRSCGICGSDLHASQSPEMVQPGSVMGHEFSGEIVELGPAPYQRWNIGDRVSAIPTLSCGQCDKCENGFSHLCRNLKPLGALMPDHLPGAYAEYIITGARDLIALPQHLSFDTGALMEPLVTGLMSVRHANLTISDRVLIIGAGPIGLTIAHWCRFFGAAHVVVSERAEPRLALAKNMGATATINAKEEKDVGAAFKKLTGDAPSVIFEAVGVKRMIQQCIEMIDILGRIVVTGICMEEDSFHPLSAYSKEVSISFPSNYSKAECQFTMDMMAEGRIDATPLITHTIDLDTLPEAFEALRTPTDQCKVLVHP